MKCVLKLLEVREFVSRYQTICSVMHRFVFIP
jgi:hypothetical protein